MAGTSQSAVEYIKNARTHLVGGLQDLSIIVEDLHNGEVLTEEEVSKIQTEKNDFDKTRTILDWVTYKGEAACYELLKIIDKTKGTLTPHLNQWISCFPFKEDVEMDINYSEGAGLCHRYQAKLKKKAANLSEVWKQSNSFLGLPKYKYSNLTYTPLVLDTRENEKIPQKNKRILLFKSKKEKKTKKSRYKKLKTCIPEDEHVISIDDLLKTHKNKILLVGKPGIGKTTAACQMLKLWGGSNNKDLDYMFYFDMRKNTNPLSLEDLLNMFSELDEAREEVLEDMRRNSEKVTIIFDGLTDLSSSVIEKLVDGDLLPDAKIIIICRPEVETEDFLYDWASLRVEVKGFSKSSIREYLTNMLNTEQLSNVQNNLELFSLCHVPAYALMVVACFSITNSMATKEPCTLTEIYLKIICSCIENHSGKKIKDNLYNCIQEYSEATSELAQAALEATKGKYLNIPDLPWELTCVYSPLLNTVNVKVQLESTGKPQSAFLHYTIQEFFAALSFLKNPDELLQYCLTEEKKYMKHLIPFLCGLCSKKGLDMLKCLAPDQQVKDISKSFIIEVINTFLSSLNQDDDDTDDSHILFLCKCLYESQSTEACLHFLDKLDFCLDLSEENLDPHHYCAVSYVISQSQEREIQLKLGDTLSEEGLCLILGCLTSIQLDGCDTLKSQLWTALLLSEEKIDYHSLLVLGGNELHLPVRCGKRRAFERAAEVMQNSPEKVHLCLLWDIPPPLGHVHPDLRRTLLESLPHISKLSFRASRDQEHFLELLEGERQNLLLDLCLDAAINKKEEFLSTVNRLLSSLSLFSVYAARYDILLDLYQHISSKGYKDILQILKPLYPPDPTVWSIDLSERKVSVLLECLELQPEKKHVELRGWSDEENEVKSFLQCLPYISQLRFTSSQSGHRFLMNLCMQAVLHERLNTQTIEQVFSVSEYWTHKWDFILDLYSHVKDYETETHNSVFPAFQRVDLPAPTVWSIDLSERKVSVLLEMLKLQPEKKTVELRGWPDEESEVKIFLQCLPYISKLRFPSQIKTGQRFLMNLCVQAALYERLNTQTIEEVFSVSKYWSHKWDFLLDLYSHVKDYETQTGRSLLPALQPVYQSAPAVWSIDLSERKVSLLLEVLKLQSEKKPIELRGWSDEDSEVKIFLQCLPYISRFRFPSQNQSGQRFLMNLCVQAALYERLNTQTIEEVFSVSEYWFHKWDFLLDLYSHVKDYETQTGRSLLPALQPVYQSAPAVWSIDLSERKVSLLLELLKLQSEKKPIELRGLSDEAIAVRIFLHCLPYISQLGVNGQNPSKFLGRLFCEAAELEEETGEEILELMSSVCNYKTFPFIDSCDNWKYMKYQCDVLLDLYFYVKNYETQTGRSLLPALQPVYQSAPAVWSIDLSKRKVSLLLEVLKLQPEKKPVELTGWSDEKREVRIFLQCLPYISQLRMCEGMACLLFHAVRTGHLPCPVAIEELSLLKTTQQSERLLSRIVSNVASLLRHWSVRCLDLTKSSIHSYLLLPLLSHHDQLTIKLCPEVLQELADVVFTAQDEDLTKSFLEKFGDGKGNLHGEMETDTCVSGCRMEDSSSLPRSRSLPSLSKFQISCIENEAGFRATRSRSLNDIILLDKTQKMTPDIIVAENKVIYTLHCTQSGLVQCSVTGLVFKMEAEGEVTYRTVPWNRKLLARHGKRPAGPLFDIKCNQGSVRQLHLPHCQSLSMGRDRSLSVAHVMDEDIELITPDVITETHVIINVTGFSAYGNVTDADSQIPVEALVLLFYIPPIADDPHSFLNVLLLPRNVVLNQVLNERRIRHPEEIYIVKPACDLIPKQKYTLSTSPTDDSIIIQPDKTTFQVDEASYKNYVETFEVIFMGGIRNHVTLCLKDSNTSDCPWKRYVCLSAPTLRKQQVKQTLSESPEDRLFSVQSSFIESVSGPTLSCIIDKLHVQRVLNDSEQDATKDMQRREDKARFVIDAVRKKGPVPSSSMILIICDIDKFLAEHLKLM